MLWGLNLSRSEANYLSERPAAAPPLRFGGPLDRKVRVESGRVPEMG